MKKDPSTAEIGFVCLLTGKKYSADYVDRLYESLVKNVGKKISFFCYTDRSRLRLKNKEIQIIPIPAAYPKWWNKIYLFDGAYTDKKFIFYLDLDVVILKSLRRYLQRLRKFDLAYAQDFIEGLSSSFLWIRPRSPVARRIRTEFVPARCIARYINDQDYFQSIAEKWPQKTLALPDYFHYSYKYFIDQDQWRARCRNPKVRVREFNEIVSFNFHGLPKPADLLGHPKKWKYAAQILKSWGARF